jgi:hypothetical protein
MSGDREVMQINRDECGGIYTSRIHDEVSSSGWNCSAAPPPPLRLQLRACKHGGRGPASAEPALAAAERDSSDSERILHSAPQNPRYLVSVLAGATRPIRNERGLRSPSCRPRPSPPLLPSNHTTSGPRPAILAPASRTSVRPSCLLADPARGATAAAPPHPRRQRRRPRGKPAAAGPPSRTPQTPPPGGGRNRRRDVACRGGNRPESAQGPTLPRIHSRASDSTPAFRQGTRDCRRQQPAMVLLNS